MIIELERLDGFEPPCIPLQGIAYLRNILGILEVNSVYILV